MFASVGLFRVAPTRGSTSRRPPSLRQDLQDRRGRGGIVENFFAIVGRWECLGVFEYPDLETAFRVLGKIAKLKTFETETFVRRKSRFWKALV